MTGKLIVFEGPDGCGKSTKAELARDYISEKGYETLMIREPGGTRLGESIRNLLLDPDLDEMSSKTELLLFQAARAQLMQQVVYPALEKEIICISDRSFISTLAYQGGGRELNYEETLWLCKYAIEGIPQDLTIIYDVPIEVSMERVGKEKDRMEQQSLDFHQQVREAYLNIPQLLPEQNTITINSTGTIEQVFDETKPHLDDIIKN